MSEFEKFSVSISHDDADLITVKNLRCMYDQFSSDLEDRQKGEGMGIFSIDQEDDCKFIKKHMKALRMILRYCGHDPKTEEIQEYEKRMNDNWR